MKEAVKVFSFFLLYFIFDRDFILSLNIGAVLHFYSWDVSSCAATQDALVYVSY